MVFVSRESVNKQLSLWVKEGLISLSPRLIVIEDSDRLHEIACLKPSAIKNNPRCLVWLRVNQPVAHSLDYHLLAG